MFAYPLPSDEEPLAGGVILLTPYTERTWQRGTTSLFDQIRPTLGSVLFSPDDYEQLQIELTKAEEKIQQLIIKKDALQADLLEKEFTIENLESALKQWKARFQIEKLESVNRIEKLQEQIDQFSAQPEDHSDISSKLEQMAAKIRQLNSERDQLKKELAKAEALINTLNIEKGQTGPIRLSMETQVVSLDSILANVRLKIASQLAALSIDLEIVNPDGHQMIKVDPELTQATLFGLLDNAIKASSPGGKVQVSQNLSLETGMLIIQVTDYGEGLTPEEQKSLFSAEPEMNPGIGSIHSIREAIRAIRVLNGKIWLKSKKGEFTTFRVQLPVRIID
jgi:signal transduction histidine kinase